MADIESPDNESLRLELKEAITGFNAQISLIAQSLGFLIAADVLLLGYGFAQRRGVILLLASLLPIAMFAVLVDLMTSMIPMSYVAINLERRLSLRDTPLIGTYVKSCQGIIQAVLGDIDNWDHLRVEGLVPKIRFEFLLRDRKTLLLLGAFIVQLCLFAVSITAYHYQFM
jgi:hypothetical protein